MGWQIKATRTLLQGSAAAEIGPPGADAGIVGGWQPDPEPAHGR